MKYVLFLLFLLVSGCESLSNTERKYIYEEIEKCNKSNSSVYFSSTRSNISFTFIPLSFITGFKCEKYTGVGCTDLPEGWLVFVPFTALDIPLSVARDIYEIPNDKAYRIKADACLGSELHNKSSQPTR